MFSVLSLLIVVDGRRHGSFDTDNGGGGGGPVKTTAPVCVSSPENVTPSCRQYYNNSRDNIAAPAKINSVLFTQFNHIITLSLSYRLSALVVSLLRAVRFTY